MSFNLIRNARMFFTTNVNATTGVVSTTGFDTTNTFEIQVLDGLSFSQNTTSEVVTINEAGAAPVRGQRSFNTALDPVEFNFSTYVRPKLVEGATVTLGTLDADDQVTAEEDVLWNALAGTAAIGSAGAGWSGVSGTGAYAQVSFANSNTHQLQKFGVLILLDATTYAIDNCVLDSATIDFGIDAIATIAWVGRGAKLRALPVNVTTTGNAGGDGSAVTFVGGISGSGVGKDTTCAYIANKLSTVTVFTGISGSTSGYTIPLTGGSFSITNNVTYLTPANLGTVNQPITYFTGTRAVTGTLNAYLRVGTSGTASLLDNMLSGSATNVEPAFNVKVSLGGSSSPNRLDLEMPAAVFTIPQVNTEQVVSTTINFTAQGYSNTAFDLTAANEVVVKYHANN